MRLERDALQDFEQGVSREWVVANGIGGYSSSTAIGANTRRYHGLLVAAINPPGGRMVLLSKLEEELQDDDQSFKLSTNEYGGAVHPTGYQYLESFTPDPLPTWIYRAGDTVLEKQLIPVNGRNQVALTYRILEAKSPVTLRLRPFITSRDFHGETRAGELPWTAPLLSEDRQAAEFGLSDRLAVLHMLSDKAKFAPDGYWYYRFYYREEAARGLQAYEDLYSPGIFSVALAPGERVALLASVETEEEFDVDALRERELARLEATQARAKLENPLLRTLVLAADSFIVERPLPLPPGMPWLEEYPSRTVIAGYHWFADWGRDTMIALPGLTLVTRRFEEARAILATFAAYTHQGLIPNRFLDSGVGADYNTVDASLWFFWAVQKYLEYTEDYAFVQEAIYPSLKQIIAFYQAGTHYGIRMEPDGLITQGVPGAQLTWMDAKIDDWVVTPRHGKAVEINALWINALRAMAQLAERAGEDPASYCRLAELATRSFRREFWNEENQCLDDLVGDPTIRPNQILAVSLPVSILSKEKARKVVDKVHAELYTSYGLRSLSPRDPRYVGHYGGDRWQRDAGYHQGTVWGWLIGPFITAYVKAHNGTRTARKQAAAFLEPFRAQLLEAGLGTISEIFDGDTPHHPRGCISQAWSVAEVLRSAVEDAQLQ